MSSGNKSGGGDGKPKSSSSSATTTTTPGATTTPTTKASISLLAQYDELVRNARAMTKGDEEEFINILRRQETARKLWLSVQEEHERCGNSISAMERENMSLETQLKHARNQIELEMERRKRAEKERESLEMQIGSIRELLVDKKDNSIMSDIDREKLFPVLNYSHQQSPGSPTKRHHHHGALHSSTTTSSAGLHLGTGGPPPSRVTATTTTTTTTTPRRILDTIDESSNSLVDDDISYDKTLDDDYLGGGGHDDDDNNPHVPVVANFTVRRSSGSRKSGNRRSGGKRPSPNNGGEEIENKVRRSDEAAAAAAAASAAASAAAAAAMTTVTTKEIVVVDCTKSTPTTASAAGRGGGGGGGRTPNTTTATMSKATSSPILSSRRASSSTILRTPSTAILSPGKGLSHPHTFVEKTIVRMETCQPCGKRITFGKTAGKCRDCKSICHLECRHLVPVPCIGSSAQKGTPTSSGKGGVSGDGNNGKGFLADFAPADRPQVPGIVVHCVKEVEARGLSEAGLYRVPGSETVVKDLLHRFLKGKGMPNLGRIDDINVICSLMKHFLRQLREPVTTYGLWSSFVQASGLYRSGSLSESVNAVTEAVTRLPPANRDTLAFLLLHLIRVADTPATKMPVHNLAKVFGPTIVGYSSPEPEALQMLNEPRMQADVLEMLMSGIGPAFWEGIVRADDASWMSFNNSMTMMAAGETTNINFRGTAPSSHESVTTRTPSQRRSGRGGQDAVTPLYLKVQSSSPVFQ